MSLFSAGDQMDEYERLDTPPAPMEAVAWRVKDYADGWILFHHEAPARKSGEARNGALVQALYTRPPQPDALPGDLLEKVERIIDPAAFMFSADELGDKVYSETRAVATGKAARILSLIQSERGDG